MKGDADSGLALDELLDPSRLAAAWQAAHEVAAAAAAAAAVQAGDAGTDAAVGTDGDGGDGAGEADEDTVADAVVDAAPELAAPLPVAQAHRELLGELDRLIPASPRLVDQAHRVLAVALARLAQLIEAPPDLAAAEVVLDELEDLLQALLSAAGWPTSGEE